MLMEEKNHAQPLSFHQFTIQPTCEKLSQGCDFCVDFVLHKQQK